MSQRARSLQARSRWTDHAGKHSPCNIDARPVSACSTVPSGRSSLDHAITSSSCPVHPSAWRGCMKSGSRVVIRYSSTHEKALPDGFIRCRMELYRTSLARTQGIWAAQNPQSSRDPERRLLPPEKWLPMAPAPSRFPQMARLLALLQEMAHRWHLGEDQPGHP